jgi:hypothetical protein
MPQTSKYNFPNAEKVQVFEYVEIYNEHNYTADETLKQQIQELSNLVNTFQQTYNPADEIEARAIINAEFHKIKTNDPTRWQRLRHQVILLKRRLLNRKNHFKAIKAAVAEIAKHYLEDSLIAKALITYAETLNDESEDRE